MAEDAIPSGHMVPPHLSPDRPQHVRGDVQHGGGRLEHGGDAVNEMLTITVNLVLHQSQTLAVQH